MLQMCNEVIHYILDMAAPRAVRRRQGFFMIVRQIQRELAMRTTLALAVLLFGLCSISTPTQAEPTKSCQQCREQQQACNKNYPGKTCKTEYDICMKSCQKK